MTRRGPVRRRSGLDAGRGGFTLFELLVVIAIIGVLAAVSVPRFGEFRAAAYDARSQQDLRNLAAVQELHRATNEAYAGAVAGLGQFRASEGVDLVIEFADHATFRARATHASGRHMYRWDSGRQPALTASVQP